MTMSDPNTRVEVTAIRWLIRPRSRDSIYLATVDWKMSVPGLAYMGQAGPDDAHVVSDARGEWRVEVIRAQFMLAVRVEVDRMCPLHGSAIGWNED
jgi:hypothetical protein